MGDVAKRLDKHRDLLARLNASEEENEQLRAELDEAEGAHERRIVGAIEKVSSQYTISCEPSDAYVLRGLELALEAIDQLPRKEQDDD